MSEETLFKKITSAINNPQYPLDLILAMVWFAVGLTVIYLPVLNATPVKYVVSIPLVFFIPGYCLLAALFPKKKSAIDLLERTALSCGLSIIIIPLIGLGLNFSPFYIRLKSTVVSLAVLSLVMAIIAFFRRESLPPKERFRVPFSEIGRTIRTGIFPDADNRVDHLIRVVLILIIIIAITAAVYVITTPKENEHFSEFYILGENRMAADYPDQINAGHSYPLFIGVGNHEYRNTTYTIETWMTKGEFDTITNTSTILVMDPLDRFSITLAHDETRVVPFNLSAKKTGYNRVEFLLFNESIPNPSVTGRDRINASYRYLNLRIIVR